MMSILIPTFNERGNIVPLVAALEEALEPGHEIIFIDDCSPDGTGEEIAALSKRNKNVLLVSRERKAGLAGAVMAGFRKSQGDLILVMDADLSHPAEMAPILLSRLESSDIAVGSRLMEGGSVQGWPFIRKVISRGAEALSRIMLGVRISDPMSGFFAIRRRFLERTRLRAKGYKLLLNILADNPGIRASEVPYAFTKRHAGKTKLDAGEMLTFVLDLFRIKFG